MRESTRRFVSGLIAGVLISTVGGGVMLVGTAAIPDGHGVANRLGPALAWAWQNLGWSLPVFGLVFILYLISLGRLRQALARSAAPSEVRQADHLTDVWTSLFFGVGVIWTAIGMRGALMQALQAEPAGGVEVLGRMVDGGILLALSTTIFGGVGGYLMRAWKAVRVGAILARYLEREAGRDLAALRASVSSIEYRLRSLSDGLTEERQ